MKFFLSICALIATASNALRFLETSSELVDLRLKCNNDHNSCSVFQSSNYGGSDNAYCASTVEASSFDKYCQNVDFCKKSSSKISGEIVAQITAENLIDNLEREEVKSKIGGGTRRKMMNTLEYGAWACQSWSQLSDNNNKKLFDADSYAFDSDKKICYLLKSDTSNSGETPEGSIAGIMSTRDCTAIDQGFPFTRFSDNVEEANNFRATCSNFPSDKKCKQITSLYAFGNPGKCATDMNLNTVCGYSDEVADKCFREVSKSVLPEKRTTVASAESVKVFLASQGSFGDFAGHIGFPENSDSPLGALTKQFVPAESEEVSCQNLLLLRSINDKLIDNIDASLYDPKTKECHLFLQSDFDASQTGKEGNFITGPDYC